jgi:transcriptional regulator with XRE-family HTH domain
MDRSYNFCMAVGPDQIRAGRALAQLSQGRLAELAGLSLPTVAAYERGGNIYATSLSAIEQALESHGVEFLPGGAVRLRPPKAEFLFASVENAPDRTTRAAASRFLNVRRKLRGEPLLDESGDE